MKKVILLTTVVALLVSLVAVPIVIAKGDNPANDKPNTLYLYEKDAEWNIVWDGAWGKMSFKLDETEIDCVFNGHKLEKKTAYSLVSFNGNWPFVTVIASGISNAGGNINLAGSVDLGAIPTWIVDEETQEGYKIWLVESVDLSKDANDKDIFNKWPFTGTVLWEHNLSQS
jgi:hypothetical protein